MMKRYLILTITLMFFSCQEAPKKSNKEKFDEPSKTWESLSSEDSFEGWHIFQNDSGAKTGWSVEAGVYTFDQKNAKGEGNKSLLSNALYSSFEIKFEWKLSANSNSGFMWGVSEDIQYEHPYLTGPEIQIIDTEIYGDDPAHQRHTVGALYDMAAPTNIVAKPAGLWNQYHITINHKKNQGIVVLNGTEINRFKLSGPDWDAMVKDSKFADMSSFGKYKEGHISLQDHPGVISYKNISIRRL